MKNTVHKPTVIATDAARGASEERVVRYVLLISLMLAILTLSFTWISAAYG